MRLNTYVQEESITYEDYIHFLDNYNVSESLTNLIPTIFKEIKQAIKEISDEFKMLRYRGYNGFILREVV